MKTFRANKKWALAHSSSPPICFTDPVRARELQTTEQLCLLPDNTPARDRIQRAISRDGGVTTITPLE